MKKTYQQLAISILLGVILAAAANFPFNLVVESALAADKYSIFSFSVHGATCAACMIEINSVLRNTRGVQAVSINQSTRPLTVSVLVDNSLVKLATVTKVLAARKYQVTGEKTLPYNKSTVAKFLLVPSNRAGFADNEPSLILP